MLGGAYIKRRTTFLGFGAKIRLTLPCSLALVPRSTCSLTLNPSRFGEKKRTHKAELSLLVRGQQALDFCSVAVLLSSI